MTNDVHQEIRVVFRREAWYVYAHVVAGTVVYIGKGRGGRAFELRDRSASHMALLGDEVEVVLLAWFPIESDALKYERAEIQRLKPAGNILMCQIYDDRQAPTSGKLAYRSLTPRLTPSQRAQAWNRANREKYNARQKTLMQARRGKRGG